ncbi:MAG TPA: hypothetical protein VGB83_01305 [Actinomycetota bacterium]
MRTRTTKLIAVAAVVVAGLPVAGRAAPSPYVQAGPGGSFQVEGTPWHPIGVNFWDMETTGALNGDPLACYYRHADLDTYFDQSFKVLAEQMHATAVRTFGFRASFTEGGRDWSSTDKLVHYAQKYGIRLIPSIGDQYRSCGEDVKDADWFLSGYRTETEPWGISYRDYVVAVASRYRASPAIAFWQLMNEATAAGNAGVLPSFSADMVSAIRTEAGDTNHLIHLGTVGNNAAGNGFPTYGLLMSCAPGGGCNDLAEAHVFNATSPMPGLPLTGDVSLGLYLWNDFGESARVPLTGSVLVEGWSTLSASVPSSEAPYKYFRIELSSPANEAWDAFIDDVVVQTLGQPRVYTFEGGTEGFTSPDATLSRTTTDVSSGAGALAARVPSASFPTITEIVAPAQATGPTSISLALKLSFRAAAVENNGSIALDLHAANARAKPFFLGEVGIQAANGKSACSGHVSTATRASTIDATLATHLDPRYGGDGLVVWDWKDPSLKSTLPNGQMIDDPTLDCWSITPGDPAVAVLRTHVDALPPAPALPPPAPLPAFAHRMSIFEPHAGEVLGANQRVLVRVTQGGDLRAGVKVRASGACSGEDVTDWVGIADFTCTATGTGDGLITVSVVSSTCGCTIDPVEIQMSAKRGLLVSGTSSPTEKGVGAPLTLTITDPTGGSLAGVPWTLTKCGLSGTVTQDVSSITFGATCNPIAAGTHSLVFAIPSTSTLAPASVTFVGLVFERLYRDEAADECVGIAPSVGWVGSTLGPGRCDAGGWGDVGDWYTYQVPPGGRATAFVRAGETWMVNVEPALGYRYAGTFHRTASTFAVSVMRPDGVHAWFSA